jgi:hypothetical protein
MTAGNIEYCFRSLSISDPIEDVHSLEATIYTIVQKGGAVGKINIQSTTFFR